MVKNNLVLGLEEAGRGPVVGPMIIAGALFDKKNESKLKKMGVKDSKLLKAQQRTELFDKICDLALAHKIIEVSPQEIDQRYAVNTNLNKLEAIKFAEIINELKPHVAIIDCPSVNIKAFHAYISQFITHDCKVKCEHYADKNHVIVGASSILAKVIRDKRIKEIEDEIGERIGLGYQSDPTTLKFVEKAFVKKDWLKFIRKSWFTFQRINEEKEQKKLSEW